MTPLNVFLCGYMNSLIYETPLEPEIDRVVRIIVSAGKIISLNTLSKFVKHGFYS